MLHIGLYFHFFLFFLILFYLDTWEWRSIAVKGDIPNDRAAHASTILNDHLILINGGMNNIVNTFDDVYVYDVG